jgi:putative hydrolase of the HAD superfamily
MTSSIRAVLFDLGDTLMYSLQPWGPVYELAGRELARCLSAGGLSVDGETFHWDFLQKLDQYYTERDRNLMETSTLLVLKELLAEKGLPDLPESRLRPALNCFYAMTQQNWNLEADATPMLAALQANGLRLGLVSNAGDSQDVFQLVEKFEIQRYFDFILTSADCGYRKPHPAIFKLALAHWGYMPDEVAMVGDKLEADVHGARPLGIYAIWIKRRAKVSSPPPAEPDETVETLAEIPGRLERLQKTG